MRWIATFRAQRKVRLFFYTHLRKGGMGLRKGGMAAPILTNSLLISLHDQIIVFGMAIEPCLYEGAIDFYRQVVGPGMVECVLRQS
jgi:hypothetical protein